MTTNTNKRGTLQSIILGSAIAFGAMWVSSVPVYATTPPDNCFDFIASSGTILEYYDTEGDVSGAPACPKDVDIPREINGTVVVNIGYRSFYDKGLNSVSFPDSIQAIYDKAFQFNNLTSIDIPQGITLIPPEAFAVNQISNITIPNSVVEIEDNAFMFNHIQSITLPASVSVFQSGPFIYQGYNPLDIGSPDTEYYYTKVYTSDSANPDNLIDETSISYIEYGGHIINPAMATIHYRSDTGELLRESEVLVGEGVSDYSVNGNPDKDLGRYYRLGHSLAYNAPVIEGYKTPADVNLVLDKPNTEYTFTYASESSIQEAASASESSTVSSPLSTPSTPSTGSLNLNKNLTILVIGVIAVVITLVLRLSKKLTRC